MIDLVTIDFGYIGSVAEWKEGKCVNVFSWEETDYIWQSIKRICDQIESYACGDRAIIAIEKPPRIKYHQYVQYQDAKKIIKRYKLSFTEINVSHIRKVVTGKGRATEEEIEEAVLSSGYLAEGVVPVTDHDFDAVSVGICYYKENE